MIKPGQVSDQLFDLADLFTTSAALAGVDYQPPEDEYLDGIDQTSFLLADAGQSNRKYEYFWLGQTVSGLRVAEYKFMVAGMSWDEPDVVNGESATVQETYPMPKLFNLYLDPKERYSFFDRQTFLDNLFSDPLNAHLETFQEYPGKKEVIQVGRQNELIERVAAVNPKTVVVLQTGGPVTMPWLDKVASVLQAWYPGQECGNAIADVLFGAVNPAGRLPQTFPRCVEDNPAFVNYPGENGKVRCGEGAFVGYRYYDKKLIEVLFPFGYGLSYTTFRYDDLRLSAEHMTPDDTLRVSVDVSNTGTRAGQEVVQLYVSDPQARLERPPHELKGFAKVSLQPGQRATVTLELGMRDLAYFDDARRTWVAERPTSWR